MTIPSTASPGQHFVRACQGSSCLPLGEANVAIEVDSAVVAPRAGIDLEAAAARIFGALAAGQDPAPSDPPAPGTVKVQFPWPVALLGLGLVIVVALLIGAKNEKWLKGSIGKTFARRSPQVMSAGADDPGNAPTLMKGLATGTHDPPKPAPGEPGPGGGQNELSMDDTSGTEAGKDVTLKGSKIKEN